MHKIIGPDGKNNAAPGLKGLNPLRRDRAGAAPEYGGTASSGPGREVYVEYRRGGNAGKGRSGKKYVFFEKDGISYFNDNDVEEKHSAWLRRLSAQVLDLKAGFKSPFFYAEFVLAGDRLQILQAGKAAAGAAPGNSPFKFENECRYNYHYTDFSDGEANAILASLGLRSRFRSELIAEGLFIRYPVLEAIENELREKVRDRKFTAAFHNAFRDFILAEAKKTQEPCGNARAAFTSLKKINFKLAVFNYLYTRVLKFSLDRALLELGAKKFAAYRERFLSPVPPQLGGFLNGLRNAPETLEREYGQEVIARLKRDAAIMRAAARFAKVNEALPRKLPGGRAGHEEYFYILRRLVALKNAANSRFTMINAVYAARIAATGKFEKTDIYRLCRLPGKVIGDMLAGRAVPRGPDKFDGCGEKTPAPGRLRAVFPLTGTVAQEGGASGVVKLVRDGLRWSEVTKAHILVADYLDESFLVPMLLCKGIIAERAGLTSHAAIIARELKKPCIVDVAGCSKVLKDGDRIRVSGGKIYRVR